MVQRLSALELMRFLLNVGVLNLCHTTSTFNDPERKDLCNIVEKAENAGNQHFLLFQQCLQSKILLFGKELTFNQTTNFRLFQTEIDHLL